jgi:ComF family protein
MPSALKCPTSLRLLADAAVAVLLAPVCASCERPLDHPTRGAVCEACWTAATRFTPLGRDSFPPFIDLAAAVGPYDGRLRDIIHALKYDRRPTIARHLAGRMRAAGADVLAGADFVVPVPLHPSRQRERGFNQARELARHLGLPMLAALVRTRRTAAQADLPAARRRSNVRGAFACQGAHKEEGHGIHGIHGRVLVLVDDVATTGATLNACAEELLDAGATEVRALVAARAALRTAGL